MPSMGISNQKQTKDFFHIELWNLYILYLCKQTLMNACSKTELLILLLEGECNVWAVCPYACISNPVY